MQTVSAHGFTSKTAHCAVVTVDVRQPRPTDVELVVLFSGICHTDLHQAHDDFGNGVYPMVPGHEVVGRATKIGSLVTKIKVGDIVAVGCMVASCQTCRECKHDEEQFCDRVVYAYNSKDLDGTQTYGGYAQKMVVNQGFVFVVPAELHKNLAGVAPLLCAGITTFSPLMRFGVRPATRMAVAGMGGLGHMAVKFGRAFGAHVTVISTTTSKKADALKLGAHHFLVSSDQEAMKRAFKSFDFIINTITAKFDYNVYLNLLDVGGTMCLVGAPPPSELSSFPLLLSRRQIVGSAIGGVVETEKMLRFCADNQIYSEVELIQATEIDKAFERMVKSDVKYRFVIDGATLGR